MNAGSNNKRQQTVAASADGTPSAMSPFAAFLQRPRFHWLLLGLAILVMALLRMRFIDMPLERDEGEYAYFGQQILDGIAPFREAYSLKLPGTYFMYALLMALFGQSASGIHIGLLVLGAGTMVLLFAGLKRLYNPMAGVMAAATYGVLALGVGVFGFAAHATQFVVFFVALALLMLANYAAQPTLLRAGLFGLALGLAFLMKQQAVFFLGFGVTALVGLQWLQPARNLKQGLLHGLALLAGIALPYLLVALLMVISGTFDKFWFWTVTYASKYAAGQSWTLGQASLAKTLGAIWSEQWPIWLAAIIGLALIWIVHFTARQRLIASALLLFGALATTPSFYFREHYFVVLLPAIALLAGLTLEVAGRKMAETTKVPLLSAGLPIVTFVVLTFLVVSNSSFKYYYGASDMAKLSKTIYGANPFVESPAIADYIHKNCSEQDRVAILGSEPQIAFYAHQHSVTGYLYFYGLMEDHAYNRKMQDEMIAEIEHNKPKYFVYVNIGTSLGRTPQSPMHIFDWAEKYIGMNYNQVGIVEVADKGTSQFFWDAAAMRHMPQGQNVIYIFRRR